MTTTTFAASIETPDNLNDLSALVARIESIHNRLQKTVKDLAAAGESFRLAVATKRESCVRYELGELRSIAADRFAELPVWERMAHHAAYATI